MTSTIDLGTIYVKDICGRSVKLDNNNGAVLTLSANPLATLSYSFNFPLDSGSPGDFLVTDGLGTTSWTSLLLNNFNTNIAPTVNDDIDLGYSIGSQWYDSATFKNYICRDNSDDAAVWKEFAFNQDLNTTNDVTFNRIYGSQVRIGDNTGITAHGTNAIAIGSGAGNNTQGNYGIAIGENAGAINQSTDTIAIGRNAGNNAQGTYSIAIGAQAGQSSLPVEAIAIGYLSNAGSYGICLGHNSNASGSFSLAIGNNATATASRSISIGTFITNTQASTTVINPSASAFTASKSNALYITEIDTSSTSPPGYYLEYNPITKEITYNSYIQLNDFNPTAITVGRTDNTGRLYKKTGDAGLYWLPDSAGAEINLTDDANAVLNNFTANTAPTVNDDTDLGYSAGSQWYDILNSKNYICRDNSDGAAVWKEFGFNQNLNTTDDVIFNRIYGSQVRIGDNTGITAHGTNAIAIGSGAGNNTQGNYGIAIGDSAGASNQLPNSIAIGLSAGSTSQGLSAVAIGEFAGQTTQSGTCIAIGNSAGRNSQGSTSIAIGYRCAETSQPTQTIAIGKQISIGNGNINLGNDINTSTGGDSSVVVGDNGISSGTFGTIMGHNSTTGASYATSLGYGHTTTGIGSISIGNRITNGNIGTIAINSTNATFSTSQDNAFYVSSIRPDIANTYHLSYDDTNKEITHSQYLEFVDITPPTHGATGTGRLYKKTGDDGLFWKPDVAGAEVDLTASGGGSTEREFAIFTVADYGLSGAGPGDQFMGISVNVGDHVPWDVIAGWGSKPSASATAPEPGAILQISNAAGGYGTCTTNFTSGNITLNTTATYTTASGVNSIGRITLKANKTYKITFLTNIATTASGTVTQLYDVTTGTPVPIGIRNKQLGAVPTAGTIGATLGVAYFKPTVDSIVESRFINSAISGSGVVYGTEILNQVDTPSYIEIECW